MIEEGIHRAVSPDGVPIAGRVDGQGPPLVLVHGSMADGESEWAPLLPLLRDRFTCFRPSTRGRGLSGAHRDLSREARVGDVAAFVDSIGEPVRLAGVSVGGMLALGAAAASPGVAAVAACEPVVFEAMDEETRSRFRDVVVAMAEAARDGRTAEAAGDFLGFVANDEEVAALSEDPEGLEAVAASLPTDLAELREAAGFEGFSPTHPSVLGRITAPVLVLHGSDTAQPWFTAGAGYVARHVPDATVREVPGIGHLGHLVHPDAVARELVPFLEAAPRSA